MAINQRIVEVTRNDLSLELRFWFNVTRNGAANVISENAHIFFFFLGMSARVAWLWFSRWLEMARLVLNVREEKQMSSFDFCQAGSDWNHRTAGLLRLRGGADDDVWRLTIWPCAEFESAVLFRLSLAKWDRCDVFPAVMSWIRMTGYRVPPVIWTYSTEK